jgi:hypothetical protein
MHLLLWPSEQVFVSGDYHGSACHDRIDLLPEEPPNGPSRVQIVIVKDGIVAVKDVGNPKDGESLYHCRKPRE